MQQYQTGFNAGYLITKHNPTLMNTISATLSPTNSYVEGMIHGKKEHEFEQKKDKLNEIENLRADSDSRGIEFGR
ncbi:MAG: hypothetical protein IPI46_08090 [Bacteroidetes bacterium]|nr:hypothetical protein [Bacteroidota bacterium]